MQGFTEKIVGLMKSEKLFESQGGPIILSQVYEPFGFSILLYDFIFGCKLNYFESSYKEIC